MDLILRLRDRLEAGHMVAVMADRLHHPDERYVTVEFLGDKAAFPASPWLMAAALKTPVVFCVGHFCGGNRYELHMEVLAHRVDLPRAERMQAATRFAQLFADRLAAHAKASPYNWFNFYDFWSLPDAHP